MRTVQGGPNSRSRRRGVKVMQSDERPPCEPKAAEDERRRIAGSAVVLGALLLVALVVLTLRKASPADIAGVIAAAAGLVFSVRGDR
jgi:hypothetical protein